MLTWPTGRAKTRRTRIRQCLGRLWLERHRPDPDDAGLDEIQDRGAAQRACLEAIDPATPVRRRTGLAVALAVALAGTAAAAEWQPVAAGIGYRHVEREGLDAHVVRVDLANEALHLVTTRESERGLTVAEFARRRSAIVAINADYFDAEMHPLGLAMGACGLWSDGIARGRRQEVVGIGARQVRIFPRRRPLRKPEPWMTGAVSGWPMIVADCRPLEHLPGSDFFTHAPHPRTAVGLSEDGAQLYLVVVDGRRERVPGVTLPELADFMEEIGACTAVNLDGGGSSTMWIGDRVVNQPSDLVERPVVNHLGVLAGRDEAPCDSP